MDIAALMKLLSTTVLFKGFAQEEIGSALLCLDGKVKSYDRKQSICRSYEPLNGIGLILSGIVYVSKENEDGSQTIYYEAGEGDIIGAASLLSASGLSEAGSANDEGYSITVAENCELLIIETQKILPANGQENSCKVRSKIVENLLRLILSSNQDLHRKLDIMSHRSLRSRIMQYLTMQAKRQQSESFQIPFSRAEFADYLLVDRSALSRELSRMADDGLITFSRNQFKILRQEHVN